MVIVNVLKINRIRQSAAKMLHTVVKLNMHKVQRLSQMGVEIKVINLFPSARHYPFIFIHILDKSGNLVKNKLDIEDIV